MLAWGVHLFTASGVVWALLATAAAQRGDPTEALLWLGVALFVDGVDGSLARALKVRDQVPNVDGDVLDLVIDYLNYVLVPALIIWQGRFLPGSSAFALTAAILLSSLYVFARRDMKTEDGYFRGFPGLWNVVALYFVLTAPSQGVAAAIVAVLVVMTFAPVHFVHPFRVRDYGSSLPLVASAWAATTAALLLPNLGAVTRSFLLIMSLTTAAAIVAMGLIRTVRGERRVQ